MLSENTKLTKLQTNSFATKGFPKGKPFFVEKTDAAVYAILHLGQKTVNEMLKWEKIGRKINEKNLGEK